jgi:large exoprotein involved in heme utilization and adhesion
MTTVTLGAEKGGTLAVTASDEVELIGTDGRIVSGLSASSRGSGDAGDLTIVTPRLLVKGGAQVSANTRGEGKGGSLLITASDAVEVIGRAANGQLASGLFAQSRGSGDAGDVTIDTPRLLVQDGAVVSAITFGEGNGGSLQITASESVELIGRSAGGRVATGLFTSSQGSGDAGDLTIDTPRLLVKGGAQVGAGTLGSGNGGSLLITASDSVEVIGESADGQIVSGLYASNQGSGNAGDLTIDTPRLLVSDGAQVSASTFGSGKGGNLTLETAQLSLSQGGQIDVSTLGTGDAGQLKVNATQIELIGDNPINGRPTGLFANVNSNATGKGGDVTIQTQGLRIIDGANLSVSTFGQGDAGNLRVTATERIEVTGSGPQGNSSSIRARVNSGATGKGGNLTLETAQLSLSQGGQIDVSTFGTGNAGQLKVNATQIELIGDNPIDGSPTGLFADVDDDATGNGGDVTIQTQGLRIIDGANLSASTFGQGDAGNLSITATERIQVSGSDPQGNSSNIRAQVNPGATGKAAALEMEPQGISTLQSATL